MEIFVQWLDDLDDLVSAAPLIWGNMRRRCLELGLAAVLVLAAAYSAVPPVWITAGAATLAAACVSAWLAKLIAAILRKPATRSA